MLLNCPFCQEHLVEMDVPAYRGLFRLYSCPACKCDVKQPLFRSREEPQATQEQTCGECAFADIHCCDCNDSVCEKHVRTVERYASYFNPGLAKELTARFGSRLYCPLCFQATVKRFSESATQDTAKPRLFSFSQLAILLVFGTFIAFGMRQCSSSRDSHQEIPYENAP